MRRGEEHVFVDNDAPWPLDRWWVVCNHDTCDEDPNAGMAAGLTCGSAAGHRFADGSRICECGTFERGAGDRSTLRIHEPDTRLTRRRMFP